MPPFLKWFSKATIILYRANSFKEREIIAEIPADLDHLPAMHSFAVSANYAIFFANPAYIDFDEFMVSGNLYPALRWNPDKPTNVYVISLKTGQVTSLEMDAFFFSHHVNSYELDSHIIIDYVIYNIPTGGFRWLFDLLNLDTLRNQTKRNALPSVSELVRITISLETGHIELTRSSATPGLEFVNKLDFPAINENYRYGRVCYVYGLASKIDGKNMAKHALVKKDLCRAGHDKAWHRKHHYLFEPWFVPNPEGSSEDDGLLFSIIFDGVNEQSILGVFDPRSMEMINRVTLPEIVNFNPHGHFFPQ